MEGSASGSPTATSEADRLVSKMKSLLRATDQISLEALSSTCEELITKYPRKASKYDAVFPIWRLHYDRIVLAEQTLLAERTGTGGKYATAQKTFEEEIRLATVHLDKLYHALARYGNTEHGQLLIYRYWIYKGDCERYRERNQGLLTRSNIGSDSGGEPEGARDRPQRTGEQYEHSVWEPAKASYVRSRRCYESALSLFPARGQAFNQLGVVFQAKQDYWKACYFYARGLDAGEKPFGKAKANLEKTCVEGLQYYAGRNPEEDPLDQYEMFTFAMLKCLQRCLNLTTGNSTMATDEEHACCLAVATSFAGHLCSGLCPLEDQFAFSVAFLLVFLIQKFCGEWCAPGDSGQKVSEFAWHLLGCVTQTAVEVAAKEETLLQESKGKRDLYVLNELLSYLLLVMSVNSFSNDTPSELNVSHSSAVPPVRVPLQLAVQWGLTRATAGCTKCTGGSDAGAVGVTRPHAWSRAEACDAVDEFQLPEDRMVEGSTVFKHFDRGPGDGSGELVGEEQEEVPIEEAIPRRSRGRGQGQGTAVAIAASHQSTSTVNRRTLPAAHLSAIELLDLRRNRLLSGLSRAIVSTSSEEKLSGKMGRKLQFFVESTLSNDEKEPNPDPHPVGRATGKVVVADDEDEDDDEVVLYMFSTSLT